ncbi:MAG TPA: hypothetical protein PKD79_04015, partial [Candidatus Doudnabacteria bacterium]|nr:hypothetical protein [Candidatus Doudnabacteria bacterium]
MITTRTVDFEQAGKTTFIFRTEIEDREQLREHLKDAQSRFKTTQRHYKIRVFETSELITRHGHRQEIFFLTF